jgi:hypothetical protein
MHTTHPSQAGFLFSFFFCFVLGGVGGGGGCDFEELAIFSQHIIKISWIYTMKKNFQKIPNFLSEMGQNLSEKNSLLTGGR